MKCKKCGCEKFSYVESIRPKVKLRWKILIFLLLLYTVSLLNEFPAQKDIINWAIFIETHVFIGIFIYQWIIRRNPQTKRICKNCNDIKWIKQ